MPSTYSPSLRIELIGAGEQAGTWNTTTNTNLGTLLDTAIAGNSAVSVTSANQALTANNGATDQARQAILTLSTTTGAAFAIYAPPQSKEYIINNTSAYVATIYNSTVLGNTTAAGTGVAVAAGNKIIVFSDGTNFSTISLPSPGTGTVTSVAGAGTVNGITLTGTVTTSGNLTLGGALSNVSLSSQVTGTLPIANGGTGSSTLAGAGIPTLTANNAFTQSSFGATTSSGSTQALVVKPNSSGGGSIVGLLTQNNGTSTGMVIFTDNTSTRLSSYNYSGTEVGYITTNGSTCTLNNFSDYRLKENVVSFTGAAIRVKQLKPKTFTWINNPSIGVAEGFIAHELQEVVPNAVNGAKDAVDDNNSPAYQGVDTTALIPLLTAALQEALSRIEALEAKVG